MKTLDEAIIAEAVGRRGNTDTQAWDDGDWIAGVVAELGPEYGKRTRIFRELARYMGRSRQTISDLCQMAETYPADDTVIAETGVIVESARAMYGDVLTVGHFREAMRAPDPTALLEEAVASAAEWGGLPMPVDKLRQRVREINKEGEPAKTDLERLIDLLERAARALTDAIDVASPERQRHIHEALVQIDMVKA